MSDFGSRLKNTRKSKKITQKHLAKSLKIAQSTIANYENNLRFPGSDKLRELSEELDVSLDYLLGLTDVSSVEAINTDKPILKGAYIQLVDLLLEGNVSEAKSILEKLHRDGIDSIEMIEELFIPMLILVGDKWKKEEISIAQEHLVTESIDRLFVYISETNKFEANKDLTALFILPPGEHHIISLKMSTEYFKIRGWNIRFIGKSIPIESLISIIEKDKIDLLVLSAIMVDSINSASYIVEALKANLKEKAPKVLLGSEINSFYEDLIISFSDYHMKTLPELTERIEKIEAEIFEDREKSI
ncbi:MAG: helix-turn-helix domain-containing protein [Tissierellia bacterium]|nr:helix-turn-helix domain-containing protein [Tissierellia bacterium]